MRVLFCSSEVVPFAKTGGLADVSGALPIALEKQGWQVKVALPKYKSVKAQGETAQIGRAIEVYLIKNERYFNRPELYGENGADYPDNLERFSFFCKQTLALIKEKGFCPEIIHCNDWQSALIPVYLKTIYQDDPFFKKTRVIFTIHNLAYQGIFGKEKFIHTGLGWELFNMHALEFYGQVNLLKGGLVFSRFITTVSPTYANEIKTIKFGAGLDGVLKEREKDLAGIINGVDYGIWNPAGDNRIFQKYTADNLPAKLVNKQKLQQELKLPVEKDTPLVGIISRLAEQKGMELILSALNKIAGLDLQFVLLGTGDAKYHQLFEKAKQKGYSNISINLCFDPILAHKIYAGCDMFLMPSFYEPCGLGQLISLKYATIPIVRKTGGLADTISDYYPLGSGNGFVFEKYSPAPMLKAITRALKLYRNKQKWFTLMRKAMGCDFSWEASAKKYIQLYQRALK